MPLAAHVGAQGARYVAQALRARRRLLAAQKVGEVTTLAGNGTDGFLDGNATAARFNYPYGIDIDPSGTYAVVADESNHRIRKIVLAACAAGFRIASSGASCDACPAGQTIDPPAQSAADAVRHAHGADAAARGAAALEALSLNVGVPRDMGVEAARALRSHCRLVAEALRSS